MAYFSAEIATNFSLTKSSPFKHTTLNSRHLSLHLANVVSEEAWRTQNLVHRIFVFLFGIIKIRRCFIFPEFFETHLINFPAHPVQYSVILIYIYIYVVVFSKIFRYIFGNFGKCKVVLDNIVCTSTKNALQMIFVSFDRGKQYFTKSKFFEIRFGTIQKSLILHRDFRFAIFSRRMTENLDLNFIYYNQLKFPSHFNMNLL